MLLKQTKKVSLIIILLFAACSAPLIRAEQEIKTSSIRDSRRFGISGNILGDPFISIVGVTFGYNITSFMRTRGSLSIPGIGVGLQFFVPGWNLSPTVGVSYSWTIIIDGIWQGFTVPLGVDWQLDNGLYLACGINITLKTLRHEKTRGINSVASLPYLSVGFFFR